MVLLHYLVTPGLDTARPAPERHPSHPDAAVEPAGCDQAGDLTAPVAETV